MGDRKYVVVNPVVKKTPHTDTRVEGYLSIPGIGGEIERPEGVVVSGRTPRPVRYHVTGAVARMMQHEIDHLDGILMLDRPDRDLRKASMRQWREWVLARAPGNQKSPSFQRR